MRKSDFSPGHFSRRPSVVRTSGIFTRPAQHATVSATRERTRVGYDIAGINNSRARTFVFVRTDNLVVAVAVPRIRRRRILKSLPFVAISGRYEK